jgi:hypothetical protein
MVKRGIVVVLLGAALAGASPHQQKDCVAWAKSWPEAKDEATERNVPIFFTIQQDNNASSSQMEGAFRDGSFIAQSKRVVCVVSNGQTEHGTKDVMVNKQKVPMCRAYDGITCEVHKGCQEPISNFFKGGQFDIPTQIWCKPDGTELFRFTGPDGRGVQDVAALVKDMERALDRISGPKINRKDWEEFLRVRNEASEAAGREEYKLALILYKKLKEHKIAKFAKEGAQAYDSLVNHGVKMVERAVKLYDRDPKKWRETLVKVAKEFKGTEAGTNADKALKELNK